MFKIGDKVVCVDDFLSKPKYESFRRLPKKDDIFTYDGFNCTEKGIDYIFLKEITTIAVNGKRHCYDSAKFRKIDDRFATETLERIKEEIEQEELVNSHYLDTFGYYMNSNK